jgi:hypothetical protein
MISYDLDHKYFLPVNINRIIHNVKLKYKHNKNEKSKLNPVTVIQSIDDLISNLLVAEGIDKISK